MARDPKYDILFEPIKLGPKTAKNRFWQTPHCAGPGSERPGTQAAFRGMKAEGGWGTVFTEYCSVSPESDEFPYVSARLWDDGDIINLGHMCDTLHSHGALAGVQLWYGGIQSPCLESRQVPRSSGDLPSNGYRSRTIYGREGDEDDIKAIINMYVEAAKRGQQAGFDILEVICSDSGMAMQFFERRYNHRSDGYGGSLENRARFAIEVLGAVKRACGDDSAVGCRFNLDTTRGASGIQHFDEGIGFVEILAREGVADVLSTKIGDLEEWAGEDAGGSRFRKSDWTRPFVDQVKSVMGDIPVVNNGRFTSPDDMIGVINAGQCDIIGAARPSIADPFLPTKVAEGRPEDIRECIGCNMCVSKFNQNSLIYCTQNATTMEEYRRGWHPEKFEKTADPCSVLVVGGGPAGMECARVLGMRGYDVHLREADDELGGLWKEVARYPRCSEWGRVITYREAQLDKLKNVEVHLGVGEMTAADVLEYGADKVVIATGSHWSEDGLGADSHAAIPGADVSAPHCLTPEQVMAGKPVGERVMVIDGDSHFTGLAMAELLADQGKQVTVVTDAGYVAEYGAYTMELGNNKRMMYAKKIAEYTGHWADKIEPDKVTLFYLYRDSAELFDQGNGRFGRRMGTETFDVACDSVVLVTSRVPNSGLYKELKARQSEWPGNDIQAIYRVGDCVAPQQMNNVMFGAHRLAREFDSPHPETPLPWIRERQIWQAETYPKLGDALPMVAE
ncbi:MAG: FAD-dependent oxidoreductase [Alphaproteobacteria bacterium]|jgi:dimethylamine/trimethylamine dehydrogenase|nr:FAD-dependent oxidoreductase [Alphaproteobacteria bacterium]MDP6590048.1 FAD-dependent oxidoreductase [Alphaproteobacteria bacterium]